MNRLFNDFFAPWAEDGNWSSGRSASFMPDIDIRETDKEYRVTIELPGVDEKDIDLSLSGNTLIVKGEKKEEHEDQDGDYYRAERSFGAFQRAIALPSSEVDVNAIKAKFKKGLLRVTLPKKPEAQSKTKKSPLQPPETSFESSRECCAQGQKGRLHHWLKVGGPLKCIAGTTRRALQKCDFVIASGGIQEL
jgi:HSP20 family protein